MRLLDVPNADKLADRFWAKVGIDDGCWEWRGHADRAGYGKVSIGTPPRRRLVRAHRIAYLLKHGEVPDGGVVCHSCDNRRCVRPGHLWLGTHADNARDMCAKGRNRWGDNRGTRNPNAKLTPEQVAQARARYAAGERQQRIADDFGVTQVAISKVVRKATWSMEF